MSTNKYADALYAIQSQWLHSQCANAPDVIVGSENVFDTIPFTLDLTGVIYWIEDCSYPGICSASIDPSLTFGYESFQNSYLYTVPNSPSEWMFPVAASGQKYCSVVGVNETDLILPGSSLCYNNMQCDSHYNLHYFNDSDCQGSSLSYSLTQNEQTVNLGGNMCQVSTFQVGTGTEAITWTTFISPTATTLVQGESLWIIALTLVILPIIMNIFHGYIAIKKAIQYQHFAKRAKFLAYLLGYILNILECVVVFMCSIQGTAPVWMADLFYGLDSGFTAFLNGVCLMEIVFRKTWQRICISISLLIVYVIFGWPYMFDYFFGSDYVTSVGIWMNYYFNSYSFPIWQIICFFFDPFTAGTIIFYIIRSSMTSLEDKFLHLIYIMFNDIYLVCLASVSVLNFVTSVWLQLVTTYSLFAQTDKVMQVYQVLFSLQHTVNSCCTIWYCLYFPEVLTRMQALKTKIKTKKSVKSTTGVKSKFTESKASKIQESSVAGQ
ncbi:hypothetical protein HDV06_002775 [Boothiomyces sp. JEL0866]|nr:hypothetical protein HDV06_002775 [Boothiomyces sp. JEL0866]